VTKEGKTIEKEESKHFVWGKDERKTLGKSHSGGCDPTRLDKVVGRGPTEKLPNCRGGRGGTPGGEGGVTWQGVEGGGCVWGAARKRKQQ